MLKKAALPLVAATALLSLLAVSPRPAPRDSFLPPNNLKIPIGAFGDKSISKEDYDAVMDRVQAIYEPIVAARGGHLVINRLWDDETVNASAEQNGQDWVINMYGGLARHPAITQDGMALVACHELGHHLGGAPKYGGDWASNEGEADYYANAKCLHRIFADSRAKVFSRMASDDQVAKKACAASYKKSGDRSLCERSTAAGMSVTQLFRALRSQDAQPHFDTPDPTVVTTMFDDHPDTQCRLDTYYQASLCAVPFSKDISNTNAADGACTASQGFKQGMRPRCWYLPAQGELTDPSVVERRSRPIVSPTLAALKTSDVFSGL